MGSWLRSSRPAGSEDWNGFLDQEVKLEGTLEVTGTFRLDGEVKGTVRSKDRLILGEKAQVEGEIECTSLSVAGKVNGNIHATNRVEILPSGLVEGEVHTPSLVIQAGGVLEGRCHMPTDTKADTARPGLTQRIVEFTSQEASR